MRYSINRIYSILDIYLLYSIKCLGIEHSYTPFFSSSGIIRII